MGSASFQADRDLSVGGRLAVAYPSGAIHSDPVPKTHLPTLSVIRRQAFVPTLFAYRGQQPIAFTPVAQRLADRAQPDLLWRMLMGGDIERAVREVRAQGLRHLPHPPG